VASYSCPIGTSQGSLDRTELTSNLPVPSSPFVGRVEELAQVAGLLQTSRLLTLTGVGGSGKTRLAIEVGAQVLDGWRDGVWLVELATVSDPSKVPVAVADAIELHIGAERPTPDLLASMLTDHDMLLILDNCEHLLDSLASLAIEILKACPKVSILATSREPLGVDAERVYRVRSLSLPPEGTGQVNDVTNSDAVQLFATRAGRRDSRFRLDEANAHYAATVCLGLVRSDGQLVCVDHAAWSTTSQCADSHSAGLQ
jgi:predicted ATPase